MNVPCLLPECPFLGTLAEAKWLIEAWQQEHNETRPHRSLESGRMANSSPETNFRLRTEILVRSEETTTAENEPSKLVWKI